MTPRLDFSNGPAWIDGVFPNPGAIRAAILAQHVVEVPSDHGMFHGIRPPSPAIYRAMVAIANEHAPGYELTLTFGRQSPKGQIEPNDVHSDSAHATVTGIVYLNPIPAPEDGTLFWRHKGSGQKRGPWDEACQRDSHDREAWALWCHVQAKYNRLLLFPSDLYHSRSLVENFGSGDEARLIQVLFLAAKPAAQEAA